MIAVSPLHAAISAHRAAYDAFQIAPEGEDSELASCEMLDALDTLVEAACAFPILGRSLPEGAGALLAHLQWWLAEEAVHAADYQPSYAILLGRAWDLAAVFAKDDDPDPIFRLIEMADAAAGAHTVACADLDENDDASMCACNQAAEDAHLALTAVRQSMPATVEGLHALAAFYVRYGELYGREDESLGHLAQALSTAKHSPICHLGHSGRADC